LAIRQTRYHYLRSFVGLQLNAQLDCTGCASFWIEFITRNPFVAYVSCLQAQEVAEFILGTPFDEKVALDFVKDEMLPF